VQILLFAATSVGE